MTVTNSRRGAFGGRWRLPTEIGDCHRLYYDVIVCGGGPAGIAAAVGAARLGASTLLIERYGFLGGMATAGVVHPWMTFHAEDKQLIAGVLQDIIDRLKERGAYKVSSHFGNVHHCFDPEELKQVELELVLDAGVRLLLHTLIVDTIREGDCVRGVATESKSGREEHRGAIIIDATGDGDMAAGGGAEYEKGRAEDGLMQPMTLQFRMGGVDVRRMPSREEINDIYVAAKERGEIDNPRENLLWFDTTYEDQIHFNTTRVTHVDGTSGDDLTRAEIESRRQTWEVVRLLQQHVPGFERAYLLWTAPQVGVRETRRIMGDYVLTEDDVLAARKFPDAVTLGSYDIDIHNPAGTGTIIKSLPTGDYYGIPYRCLLPRGLEGLLVAGRPISTTHEAHSSVRIQAICSGTGHAAGIAAALAAK
ncbi:MAG: FAD-dependent oxidoreductase, partial [Armatimonadota bacterium]